MQLLYPTGLLLTLLVQSTQAGSIANTIEVNYRPKIILGETSVLNITAPTGVIFAIDEVFYAPNGTTTLTAGIGNAINRDIYPNYTWGNGIIPGTNETCIERDLWAPGVHRTWSNPHPQLPDSVGDGWGYSVNVKLYFSITHTYTYTTNSTTGKAVVCITNPYLSEELQTTRHNISVVAGSANAVDTAQNITEQWALSPASNWQTFTVSGAGIVLPAWSLIMPTFFIVLPFLA